MQRVTRSRTNAENNGKVGKPKYTEPNSDVEDEDKGGFGPVTRDEALTSSKPYARKSVTSLPPRRRTTRNDDNVKKEKNEVDVVDKLVAVKRPAKKGSGKHKSLETAVKEELQEEELGNCEDVEETDEFAKVDYVLSEKELKLINKAFDMNLPSSSDENLTSANIKTAMRHLGYEPRVIEIRKLMKQFSNPKGKINRDAFHKIMAYKHSTSTGMNHKSANDEITKVFNLFDVDKTGKISLNSLKSIAKELNEDLTEEELLEMIDEADQNGDKLIDKIEFENIMKRTSLY